MKKERKERYMEDDIVDDPTCVGARARGKAWGGGEVGVVMGQ